MSVKHKESKKQRDKATLASVTKEMAWPRFAESARKEEEANHGVMKHDYFSYSERNGSQREVLNVHEDNELDW